MWIKNWGGGGKHLVPLINQWKTAEEIDFESLPSDYVLKLNHGCAMNVTVRNVKNQGENLKDVKNKLHWWLKTPYWAESIEPQYRYINRRIIAERYIEEMDGSLYDYKLHCFHGEPVFIQCIGERDLKSHSGFQMNYDLCWNRLPWTFSDYPDFQHEVKKPETLNQMIQIARILSDGVPYVRVDLYEINGNVLFGEMTFTPYSGFYNYRGTWNADRDLELGRLIRLPVM